MNSRMRSPSYPSTSLNEAIEIIAKLHKSLRTNAVDREVAAKELGYTGISGRSATVLSNLIQYGLLEKTGKNEVRVSSRAVEILHPDSRASKATAIRQAAEEPELFQRIMERFTDGPPSTNALHSFFVKEGFTDTAIPSAIRAFQETFSFAENVNDSGSYSPAATDVVESELKQPIDRSQTMTSVQPASTPSGINLGRLADIRSSTGAEVYMRQKLIQLGGSISSQKQAEELIAMINALKPMLQVDVVDAETGGTKDDGSDI